MAPSPQASALSGMTAASLVGRGASGTFVAQTGGWPRGSTGPSSGRVAIAPVPWYARRAAPDASSVAMATRARPTALGRAVVDRWLRLSTQDKNGLSGPA